MRNQPDSSCPPSAVTRRVSCCRTLPAGSTGSDSSLGPSSTASAAGGGAMGEAALVDRRAGSARAMPKAPRRRPLPRTPRGPVEDCRRPIATRRQQALPGKPGRWRLGAAGIALAACPTCAKPASKKAARSNSTGPSGVASARPNAARRQRQPRRPRAPSRPIAERRPTRPPTSAEKRRHVPGQTLGGTSLGLPRAWWRRHVLGKLGDVPPL